MARYETRQKLTFRYDGHVYSVYGYSDTELTRKKTEKIEALKRNELLIESGMSVKAWAEQFVEVYKAHDMNANSLKNYQYNLDHYILESIGSVKLKNVKSVMLQGILNEHSDKSQSLIHKLKITMNEMFEKAVENDLIMKNPARNLTEPKGTKGTRRSLTAREEEAFLTAAKKHQHGLLFMLMWGCGCRPSEAENVCGRDIQTIKGKLFLHIRGTKTKAADRYVPIPPEVAEMLPENPEPFLPLCRTSQGNKIDARHQRRLWKSMEREMNIALGCKMHRNELLPPYPLADDLCSYCLRHTFCTNLQKRGVDIRTAQKLMGHASITMTANIYSHTGIDDLANDFDKITGATAKKESEKWQKVVTA